MLPKLAEKYISYIKNNKGRSKGTLNDYSYTLKLFFEYMLKLKRSKLNSLTDINDDFIKSINDTNIDRYMSYLSVEKENSASTVRQRMASVIGFFTFLHKKKYISDNPVLDIDLPKLPKRLPEVMSLEESKKLLETIDNSDNEYKIRDKAMITLFLHCGLRLSELISINIDSIKGTTLKVLGKGQKERTIYLNDTCIKAVANYLEVRQQSKDKALFLSERKKRISDKTVQVLVKDYMKEAGLDTEKYHVHSCRHTAATLMYKHGKVDIRALQEILGHESITTTQIYTHIDSEQCQAAVNANPLNSL